VTVPVNRRLGGAFGVSAALHVGVAVAFLLLLTTQSANAPAETPPFPTKFVFISTPGMSGGGGGNPAPASTRQPLEIPAHRQPAPVPITAVATPPPPAPVLDVPVETDAAKILQAAGLSPIPLAASTGGDGRGTTAGSGADDGVGPGRRGGMFDGPYSVGGDVTSPVLVTRVAPSYTSEAMVAKVTGVVMLEAVVRADGTVGDVRVVKSLDAKRGLDQAAIAAAKQWVFKPGTRRGQAVDVIVTLVLEFRLH
jgi:protein TonB